MSPPLRDECSIDSLWEGLKSGIIETIGTDHCPFMLDQKMKGLNDFRKIPNGVPGVENRFELIYSEGVSKGKISLNDFVNLISTNPAKIFGMYPTKGVIEVGSDADLVIFDPNTSKTYTCGEELTRCDYTIYEGMQVKGVCEKVLLRGKVVVNNGEFLGREGDGKYICRV